MQKSDLHMEAVARKLAVHPGKVSYFSFFARKSAREVKIKIAPEHKAVQDSDIICVHSSECE